MQDFFFLRDGREAHGARRFLSGQLGFKLTLLEKGEDEEYERDQVLPAVEEEGEDGVVNFPRLNVLFRKALRASVITDEIGDVGPENQEKLRQGVEQERRNLIYRLSVVRTFVRGKLAAVRALTNSVYERLDNYIVEAIKMQNAAVNEAVRISRSQVSYLFDYKFRSTLSVSIS